MLDKSAVSDIARRIDISITRIADLEGDLVTPDIILQVSQSASCEPSRFSVRERPFEPKDMMEAMAQLSESNEAFEQRQRRSHDAFLEFTTALTLAKARIILAYLSIEEFTAVVRGTER